MILDAPRVHELALAVVNAPATGPSRTSPQREWRVDELWTTRRGTAPVYCARCTAEILEGDADDTP